MDLLYHGTTDLVTQRNTTELFLSAQFCLGLDAMHRALEILIPSLRISIYYLYVIYEKGPNN